jgi:hypothetical protein
LWRRAVRIMQGEGAIFLSVLLGYVTLCRRAATTSRDGIRPVLMRQKLCRSAIVIDRHLTYLATPSAVEHVVGPPTVHRGWEREGRAQMVTNQLARSMSRWGLACMLATAAASTSPSALAARPVPVVALCFALDAEPEANTEPKADGKTKAGAGPGEPTEQKPDAGPGADVTQEADVELEVRVAPEIVEAVELQRWVHEEGRRVLDGLPDETVLRGSLLVEIGGALYDYQVTISVLRDDAPMSLPSVWKCECSNEELLEKLRVALPERAGVLEVEEPEPLPEPVITSKAKPVVPHPKPKRGRLGPAGVAGVTLMTTGALGVGVGVALMELGKLSAPEAWGTRRAPYLLPPGAVIVGTSISLVVTGFAIHLLRDKPRHRRRAGVAAVGPGTDGAGQLSLTVNGRF